MRKRISLKVLVVVAALLLLGLVYSDGAPAHAALDIFGSPVNGGCYIAAENQCRIHIDPFTIKIQPGSKLEQFTLYANGNPIYDFRTDVSSPPGVDYSPSPVALDFAASCGVAYVVSLQAKDSLTDLTNAGATSQFTCPSSVP